MAPIKCGLNYFRPLKTFCQNLSAFVYILHQIGIEILPKDKAWFKKDKNQMKFKYLNNKFKVKSGPEIKVSCRSFFPNLAIGFK